MAERIAMGRGDIRIDAPADMDRLDIAQAVMGPEFLLKAERLKGSERTFQHYRAMQQSAEQFERAYRKQMDRILLAVRAYAEEEIIKGKLAKSEHGPYDSIANPEHLKAVRGIVNDHHLAFIATQVGPEYVAAADIQRLIDSGVLPADMQHTYDPALGGDPAGAAQSIADAYNYGISMGRDPQLRGEASALGLEPWRIKHGDPELSSQEESARTWASGNAANTIMGLGNRVAADFSTQAIEADADLRARYQGDIRQELDMNLERQQSWRQLASDLGHRTQDWARDFKRIAATEKQQAMQQGLTAGLIEREGDPDEIMVAKQPNPGACFIASTRVMTLRGNIPIEQVRVGDRVLTHKLRWRPVLRVFRRSYEGLVFGVDGRRPCATENHPFLADMRWQRADALKAGQHVVSLVRAIDAKDQPAHRAQDSFLAGISLPSEPRKVPISAVQLHRDLLARNGDIDVEGPDRQLQHHRESGIFQHAANFARIVGRHALRALSGAGYLRFCWDRACEDARGAGILRSLKALFGRHSLAADVVGFTASAHIDACFTQAFPDRQRADTMRGSDSPRSIPGFIGGDDGGHIQLFSDIGHRLPIAAECRAVETVVSDWFEGYVYNFAVAEDESYFAEGLAVHNCPDCVRLHYTSGEGSPLRIFKLSELQGNGTNVGKKRTDWQAVVGVVHPWCGCELIHIPNGWGFNEDGDLMPESLMRAELLPGDLRKSAHLTWGGIVPERGVAVRLGDPRKVAIADEVIARTPKEIFDKRVGITLICEDEPRVENAMSEHDLAYWTGNEIRVSGRLAVEKLRHVLEHEIGHSLNVWLMYCWGGEEPVIKWHAELYQVSKGEGFVSAYAKTAPIENAAELTRLYLYERSLIMKQFPRAFAMLHGAYKGIWRQRNDRPLADRPGEPAKQRQDAIDERRRGGARL